MKLQNREYFKVTDKLFKKYEGLKDEIYKSIEIRKDLECHSGYRVFPRGLCTSLVTFISLEKRILGE
tara:strand:+ start:24128 stop:24328 length:201 start_codon:yes stop_codon:yes gene_type:complete